MKKPSLRTLVDLGERAGATFAQAFLASITLGHTVVPALTDLVAAKVALIAGAYSVAKFAIVAANAWLGKNTPATDPPK